MIGAGVILCARPERKNEFEARLWISDPFCRGLCLLSLLKVYYESAWTWITGECLWKALPWKCQSKTWLWSGRYVKVIEYQKQFRLSRAECPSCNKSAKILSEGEGTTLQLHVKGNGQSPLTLNLGQEKPAGQATKSEYLESRAMLSSSFFSSKKVTLGLYCSTALE